MASNPGQVPAGGKEKISVVVDTQNLGGHSLHKRFSIETNDPLQPRAVLSITGTVEAYLNISASYVQLVGSANDDVHQTIQILPVDGYPFAIKTVKVKEGKDVAYELAPLGNDPRRDGYALVVRNTRTAKGTYRDLITIETDLKEKPSFRIAVMGRIFETALKAD